MFGGIASAIGSIAGGLLSNKSAREANELNAALTREQLAYQKELHKNQIQWRVQDSQKAGLHPLAGLGVSSYSFSPVASSQSPLDYSWLGEAGQNVNAAVQRGKDARERKQAEALAADAAQLQNDSLRTQIEGQMLDNDIRRMEIMSRMSRSQDRTQVGPPAPSVKGVPGGLIDGQEQSGYPDIPAYAWQTDHRGLPTELSPSEEVAEMWSEVPVVGNLPLLAGAKLKSLAAKLFGWKTEGKYWDDRLGAFVDKKPTRKTGEFNYKNWLLRRGGYY